MEEFRFLPKNKVSKLPKNPGVYAFKKGSRLLYIGKAINIRERVKGHDELLGLTRQLGYIKADSEIEALILEANLIKRYQPKYNVVWRDDKNYFYICITKEDFPRVFITHQPKQFENTSRTVGPFVDGKALKQTLKVLRKAFPYRTCKNLPRKPCLWYQLDRCPAPCILKSKLGKQIVRDRTSNIQKESQRNIRNLIKILQGKKKQVLANLKKEMKAFSQGKKFEEAAKIRDQISALERVLAHSHIFTLVEAKPQPKWQYKRIEAYDISNIQGKEATGSMVTFINGKPQKALYRKFKIKAAGKPNDVAMIKEVISRRLKHSEWGWPDLILIDGGKAQLNAAASITKIPVMALAKKRNELYVKGRKKPVLLKTLPRELFNLILQLRDEAHRFAKAYHHKLRNRSLLSL